jgi:hypothetical protein
MKPWSHRRQLIRLLIGANPDTVHARWLWSFTWRNDCRPWAVLLIYLWVLFSTMDSSVVLHYALCSYLSYPLLVLWQRSACYVNIMRSMGIRCLLLSFSHSFICFLRTAFLFVTFPFVVSFFICCFNLIFVFILSPLFVCLSCVSSPLFYFFLQFFRFYCSLTLSTIYKPNVVYSVYCVIFQNIRYVLPVA